MHTTRWRVNRARWKFPGGARGGTRESSVATIRGMIETVSSTLTGDLQALLPPDRVLVDPAELFVYEADGFTIAHSRPAAVVFPINTDEVVAIVRTLVKHGAQIVPRGSGTGLAGGCVAYNAGVVVSTA